MLIVVKDANILIDLEKAALFDLWFQLAVETHTTDFVEAELEEERQPNALAYIRSNQIICHEIDEGEFSELIRLQSEVGRGLSLQDCSALFLVRKIEGSVLITGDGSLRTVANEMEVEVHGLLWILDILVKRNLLRPLVAAVKLEHLLDTGSHLPAGECNRRILSWRKKK